VNSRINDDTQTRSKGECGAKSTPCRICPHDKRTCVQKPIVLGVVCLRGGLFKMKLCDRLNTNRRESLPYGGGRRKKPSSVCQPLAAGFYISISALVFPACLNRSTISILPPSIASRTKPAIASVNLIRALLSSLPIP